MATETQTCNRCEQVYDAEEYAVNDDGLCAHCYVHMTQAERVAYHADREDMARVTHIPAHETHWGDE